MSVPTLNIRCPSWSHLENFYSQKVKDGNVLLARVPFAPTSGSDITIALELPDGLKIHIPGEVEAVKQAPDGRKSAIRMVLQGLDGAMRLRLEKAVKQGRAESGESRPIGEHRPEGTRTEDDLPLPIPADVPIDELVPLVILRTAEEVPEASRAQYRELEETLRTLREKAAHEVLGVEWDAEVATIRLAYFKLIKQYHPDVMARHESPDISLLASELFIYINKAYDRLRDSAVSAGKAIAAGPALLPHDGWLADFSDIGPEADDAAILKPLRWAEAGAEAGAQPAAQPAAQKKEPAPKSQPSKKSTAKTTTKVQPQASALTADSLFNDARITNTSAKPLSQGVDTKTEPDEEVEEIDVDEFLEQGRTLLEDKDYEAAREILAKLLEAHPRNRVARALYHVSYGHTLMARQMSAEALTQFEVALKHDPDCLQAEAARATTKSPRKRRASLLDRIFRR